MKYVIIGNSAAAVGAVEGIRQFDRESPITLISREAYPTYSRPLISYWLGGKKDEAHLNYRGADFYAQNGCTVMLSRLAAEIDAAARQVVLDDNSRVEYDKLLLAVGSKPNWPNTPGLNQLEHAYTFLQFDDAKKIAAAVTSSSRVLVWGAGLIGLKCAEALCGHVGQVTVLNRSAGLLRSILDDETSPIVEQHVTQHGIRLRLGDSIERFAGQKAYLSSGDTLDFDVLILAVGVQPNTDLCQNAGGAVADGIVTNPYLETSLPGIYAAGDCAACYDLSSDTTRVMATLPNAYMEGECAGWNMAGAKQAFAGTLPVNSVSLFGLQLATAGSRIGETYAEHRAGAYKKLYYDGDRLRGFILIGNIARAGIYTDLIRKQTFLSTIDFPLICKQPGLIAFAKPDRREKLGGVAPV
jgi:NAD(P)H-nitrite reductase large subunit